MDALDGWESFGLGGLNFPHADEVIRERLFGLFHVDLVHRFGVRLFFFEAHPFVAGGLAPGGHVFFDPFVVGEDFEDLAHGKFFDFLGGENNGHGAEVPQRIERDIGLDHLIGSPHLSPHPSLSLKGRG